MGLTRGRERKGGTLAMAARALGISRQTLPSYEQGNRPIPRLVALATKALEAA